jgi:activator of HSP90 ATPase
MDEFQLKIEFDVSPEELYSAWLDSEMHSEMTGAGATIDPRVGGQHSAWDGYITGTTLELEPFRRIVQSWRTSQFPVEAPDSRVELLFEETEDGTLLTIVHTGIPEGQGDDYLTGWQDYYFDPMEEYFEG